MVYPMVSLFVNIVIWNLWMSYKQTLSLHFYIFTNFRPINKKSYLEHHPLNDEVNFPMYFINFNSDIT